MTDTCTIVTHLQEDLWTWVVVIAFFAAGYFSRMLHQYLKNKQKKPETNERLS